MANQRDDRFQNSYKIDRKDHDKVIRLIVNHNIKKAFVFINFLNKVQIICFKNLLYWNTMNYFISIFAIASF
jgi:hypothetical protein